MARSKNDFQTIRSEGGLLPADLLRRVVDPKGNLPGSKPEDYKLPQGERINEAITQSWNRLRRHWAEFRAVAKNLPAGEPGTGLTNDKWSVPCLRELGFGLLPTSLGPEIDGRTFAINRFFGSTAIHLVGCGLSLDRRAAGVRGAAAANPHGLVQEFLNRSPGHLWAIVSNGLSFRILRDNQALSRQSYLEFDLDAMFTGEVFSDFVLLWLMAHATRFAPQADGRPETSWLEQWTKVADEEGTRALGDLRAGVEKALQIFGEAFVSHPRNTALREALRSEELSLSNFHGQLLRLVYRLIFLFVAEDRTLDGVSLIHPRDDSEVGRQARDRFDANYSTARLRDLAAKIKGSRHGDLWQQFNLLVGALSGDERFETARRQLALPVLGSFLWSPDSTSALNAVNLNIADGVELANADFLEALRHLAYTRQGKVLRPVDYKNLGAEELGGVYETLLALTPQISGDGARFTFAEFAGNERKTSGSYYTPDSLVQCLLDSALDPVVEEALKGKTGADAEKAILSLKVCDPAVGSGHFLVGAAHRLARHLARVRANTQGESEPSPLLYQHALRDVIGHCLYGVDINPMSAELCRVGLWLEALEPGKPLSFLDHHIQVGNSLLGTTPALLMAGIPDEAFTTIEGDMKAKCTELKRENKRERQEHKAGQVYLFEPPIKLGNMASDFARLSEAPDDTVEAVAETSRRYTELVRGTAYQYGRLLADTWCAAFVWKKDDSDLGKLCPTERDFRKVENEAATGLLPHVREEVVRLARQYEFFHWHLAFPDVFRLPGKDDTPENEETGWSSGFDIVLGNPPWERVKLQEKEFFASRNDLIAIAPNAAVRKRLIASLPLTDPQLWTDWCAASRLSEGQSQFVRQSGRYPLCGKGDVNTYALFAEHNRALIRSSGRAGFIIPTGIATDDTTKEYFKSLVDRTEIASFFSFENEEKVFPGVHNQFKFALLVLDRSGRSRCADLVFFARNVAAISDPDRHVSLTPADFGLLNPNTRTCATFRSRRDADINLAIYRRTDVLWREEAEDGNPWSIRFLRMLDMANDSGLFRTSAELTASGWNRDGNRFVFDQQLVLPLYEAKLVHHFDHRFSTYEGATKANLNKGTLPRFDAAAHLDPDRLVASEYWVADSEVSSRCDTGKPRGWFVGWRDVTRSVDERTLIAAVFPYAAVSGKLPVLLSSKPELVFLAANLASLVADYAARQKVGGASLSMFVMRQLPILRPETYSTRISWSPTSAGEWLLPRVLELTYTAWDLEPFARDCGYAGPPFRWDEERRFLLRAELDAAFFHLYGLHRDDTAYILDTFPIVRRKDEQKYNGEYKTKTTILEIYDALSEATRTGQTYQTRLDPPPSPPAHLLPDWPPGSPRPTNWPTHIHPPRGVHESH